MHVVRRTRTTARSRVPLLPTGRCPFLLSHRPELGRLPAARAPRLSGMSQPSAPTAGQMLDAMMSAQAALPPGQMHAAAPASPARTVIRPSETRQPDQVVREVARAVPTEVRLHHDPPHTRGMSCLQSRVFHRGSQEAMWKAATAVAARTHSCSYYVCSASLRVMCVLFARRSRWCVRCPRRLYARSSRRSSVKCPSRSLSRQARSAAVPLSSLPRLLLLPLIRSI